MTTVKINGNTSDKVVISGTGVGSFKITPGVYGGGWTWDGAYKASDVVLSNGNLTASDPVWSEGYNNGTVIGNTSAVINLSDHKMFSIEVTSFSSYMAFGFANRSFNFADSYNALGQADANGVGVRTDGVVYYSNSSIYVADPYQSGDVIDLAIGTDVLLPGATGFWYRITRGGYTGPWLGTDSGGGGLGNPETGTYGFPLYGVINESWYPAVVPNTASPGGAAGAWTILTSAGSRSVPAGYTFVG